MTHEPDDADLRARFAALREEDAASVPAFRLPGRRGTPARAALRWAAAGSLAAAVLATLWFAGTGKDARTERFSAYMTTTAWRGPTDFLLQTPGREFLTEVPAIAQPDVGITPRAWRRTGTDTARPNRRDTT